MWADDSPRRARLPDDWQQRRSEQLRRDKGICQKRGPGCVVRATHVDHIIPGDDHSQLQSLCKVCHGKKSAQEGVNARSKKKRSGLRSPERHPGRL